MNIEETKAAIEVMQAFTEGKKIRFIGKLGNGPVDWCFATAPTILRWDWSRIKYEVAPETPQDIARRRAEVMLAYADGKEIEYRDHRHDSWSDAKALFWAW